MHPVGKLSNPSPQFCWLLVKLRPSYKPGNLSTTALLKTTGHNHVYRLAAESRPSRLLKRSLLLNSAIFSPQDVTQSAGTTCSCPRSVREFVFSLMMVIFVCKSRCAWTTEHEEGRRATFGSQFSPPQGILTIDLRSLGFSC